MTRTSSVPSSSALFFFFLLLVPFYSHSLNSDGLSLLALKSAITSDPTRILSTWSDSDSTPCHWLGVKCSSHSGRVTDLSLVSKGLTGYIPSELGFLDSLLTLSLSHNNFSNPIPLHLFRASSLSSLDLSHNSLLGPIPHHISSLPNLTFLDFSSNRLNGSLPLSLPLLTRLSGVLNLSNNLFSGPIPPEFGSFPVFVSLDLRNNNLTGNIPQVGSLLNQGPTAFSGNPGLCGFPLRLACPGPAPSPGAGILSTPEDPLSVENSRLPTGDASNQRSSITRCVQILSGFSVVVVAVFVSVWLFRKKRGDAEFKFDKNVQEIAPRADEVETEEEKGKFVVIDEELNFEMEDMLRASAYVVGKSKGGIVYKVVVGGCERGSGVVCGTVVAVRRLSENDMSWKFKDFVSEVEVIGRVQHPNIVRLRAYYYAHDEKLLISDFVGNGNLHAALHGWPSNTLPPLSWAARFNIAVGIARGLAHIHEQSPRKYVHGNIKSLKILLDDDLQPYISGFGLARLVCGTSKSCNSTVKKQSLNQNVTVDLKSSGSVGYVAPEARCGGSKFTQKCDVYSFGIVLLEILTGMVAEAGAENENKGLERFVREGFREERALAEIIDPGLLHEVSAKKQVVAAFHIALNCTEKEPEMRPRMKTVCESLDGIRAE